MVDSLRLGLREHGYLEGKNLAIEFRWADGNYELLPKLADELARLGVDVIVTHGTPGTRAAKQATKTIPVVMATSGDAVASGLVDNLSRPGGNVVGSTLLNPAMMAKRLELFRDAMPRFSQAAVLLNADNPSSGPILRAMGAAAEGMKLGLHRFSVHGPKEFEAAFSAMVRQRIDAVVISQEAMFLGNARRIAELALGRRLPSAGGKEYAEAGGLIGYGANFLEMYRRAAYFVDKILKGAKPSELPVEQATKFELVVNLKTAKTLGLTMSQQFLLRADKVIE